MTNIILKKPDKKFGDVEYYNTFSIADILKIDPTTVRNYFCKGYFHGIKIGQNWYVTRGDLEFFIINGKLKRRKEMSFQDYKIIEANFIKKTEENLKRIKGQIKELSGIRSAYAIANLKRQYESLKQSLEEYKEDKMTKKDYDTII